MARSRPSRLSRRRSRKGEGANTTWANRLKAKRKGSKRRTRAVSSRARQGSNTQRVRGIYHAPKARTRTITRRA